MTAAAIAVVVIAAATVGIILLNRDDGTTSTPPTTSQPPSFPLTNSYPSLSVSTDPAKAQDEKDATDSAESWADALNDRDEDGMLAQMCEANSSLNVGQLAAQVDEGTMKVTSVVVSGDEGLADITFRADDEDTDGSIPLVKESDAWKVCLRT